MASGNEVFQKLKPHCIQLSQQALALAGRGADIKGLISALESLLLELNAIQKGNSEIDAKLAEYVFFPLSHVLKASQVVPGRALELTLECLNILLMTGWQRNLPKDLGVQLVILLGFLVDTSETKAKSITASEELQTIALKCLSSLFRSFSLTSSAKISLTATENVPQIGNCLSLLLDAIVTGRSSDIQLAAAQSLQSFLKAVDQQDVLSSFLPGIVSALSKVLTSTVQSKRSYKVLQSSLESLTDTLLLVISDKLIDDLLQNPAKIRGSTLTPAWLTASAGQIKQALSNVVNIRKHERQEVRDSLARLCIIVLEDCRKSLEQCSEIMINTSVSLITPELNEYAGNQLKKLIRSRPEVSEHLKSVFHGWVVSLPRLMASQNDNSKRDVIQRISTGFKLLHQEGYTVSKLDSSLVASLRDSMTVLIRGQTLALPGITSNFLELVGQVTNEAAVSEATERFQPIFGRVGQQLREISELKLLLKQIGNFDSSLNVVASLLDTAQAAKGEAQVASFWLAKTLIDSTTTPEMGLSDFIELDHDAHPAILEAKEDLYAQAVSIVTNYTNETNLDWRLRALALETVASQAKALGLDYRPELIDTLYPMLHHMGSSNERLRKHALTCINLVAHACQYDQASDMIIKNVDYLINSVSLKLNAFELSPQAPQVLLMMVRLSGPSLLPYLEDLVSSMFSALESFHGYPRLVELLFSVFRAMSEEGVKAKALTIEDVSGKRLREIHYIPPTISDVIMAIKDLCHHLTRSRAEEEKPEPFPEEAWGKERTDDDDTDEQQGRLSNGDDAQPSAPKSYNLLLKIAELAQHYLPSSSPGLRVSLLSLLQTTFPALATHENSFLPLINTLWPVLHPRLDDPEAFIVSSTMDVIGLMCVHGGNFMKSRIDEVWPTLLRLDPRREFAKKRSQRPMVRHTNRDIHQLLGGAGDANVTKYGADGRGAALDSAYVDSPSRMIWKSYVELFVTIVGNVAINDEKYDDALDLMEPLLSDTGGVRDVFESRNPDAVWLRMSRMEGRSDS